MNTTAAVQYSAVFFILLILGLLFGAFDKMNKNTKKWYLFFVLSILAIMTMFRDFSVGNDTETYVSHFLSISQASDPFRYISQMTTEPGFVIYAWLLSKISTDPRILFAVTGAIIYMCIGRFLNRYSETPGTFIMIFFSLFTFNSYLSGVRQALSCAILLVAIDFIIRKKHIPALLFIFLAISFHYSAFAFLAIWLIIIATNKDNSQGYIIKIVAFSVAIMVGFEFFLSFLLRLFPKYEYYLGDTYLDGQIRLASIVTFFIHLLLVIVPSLMRKDNEKLENLHADKFFTRVSIIGVCIIAVSFFATILSRLGNITYMCIYARYGNNANIIRKQDKNILNVVMLILLYLYGLAVVIYRTPEWQSTFPYKFG